MNTWDPHINAGDYFISIDGANGFNEQNEDYQIRVRDVTGDSTVVRSQASTLGISKMAKSASLPKVAHRRSETIMSSPALKTEPGDSAYSSASVTPIAEPEPLAAAFYEPPESHGGSAFTMLLGFTEEFPLTEETLRANLSISGGQLTTVAEDEAGRTRNWNVTITPAEFQTVTITLPVTTDCSGANAICTEAGKPLAETMTLSVPHYTIPRVSGVTVTGGPGRTGAWNAGDTATIDVQFNKAVTVSGLPDHEPTLGILVGGTRREAAYVSGSGTGTLTFSHQVSSDDAGTTTIEVVDNGISLGETGIADAHSQDAVLTFEFYNYVSTTAPPIRALFKSLPSSHDEASFTFEIAFSEEPTEFSSRTLQGDDENPSVLSVAKGTVDRASRLEAGQERRWEVVITPSGSDPVTITLPGSGDCTSVNSICRNARRLAGPVTATVPGPASANTAATGTPAITGTAELGQTLTADTSAIADDNGIEGAEFTHQWVRVHDGAETGISGAAGSTYTVTIDDADRDVKVQVSFTDDQYNDETVTSAAVHVPQPDPLTAEFRNLPEDGHDGSDAFTMRVAFNYPITIGWETFRDHSLTATGGGVTKTNRVDGRSDLWQITVEPSGNDDVVVSLTPNRACDTSGAICNSHGMMLSNEPEAAISGPGTITAETPLTAELKGVPDSHNGSGTFTFRILFSEPVNAGYAALKQHAFQVSNATITKARRVDRRDDLREFTVEPSSNAAVILALPTTEDCTAQVAICTAGGKPLSTRLEINVPGPEPQQEPEPAPANTPATGTPAITGTAELGQTLTVVTSGITDPDGLDNAGYSYQWIANDGTADTDIQRATASTYTLADADRGKTVKVRVSFTDDEGNEEMLTSDPTATVQYPDNTPATGQPTINGTAQVGETLTADVAGISDEDGLTDPTFTYQWIAGEEDISGATGSTYTLTYGRQGQTIQVRVSFTDDANNQETLTSEATVTVTPAPNRDATGAPNISGTVQVDETLAVSTSDIADEDGLNSVSYSYQWIRVDGSQETDIAGETSSSYTLVLADQGKTIKVKVSFTDDADNDEDADQRGDGGGGGGSIAADRQPGECRDDPRWLGCLHLRNPVQRGIRAELQDPQVPRLRCNGR